MKNKTTIARRSAPKRATAPSMDADVIIFEPDEPSADAPEASDMNIDYDRFAGETAAGSLPQSLRRGTVAFDRGAIRSPSVLGRFAPRGAAGRLVEA